MRTASFKEEEIALLEQFLDQVPDPQQDHGADEGANDLAIPLGPEGSACAKLAQQPAADQTAEEADDDVPDETTFVLDHEEAGQPACDGSEEQGKNNVHNIGY